MTYFCVGPPTSGKSRCGSNWSSHISAECLLLIGVDTSSGLNTGKADLSTHCHQILLCRGRDLDHQDGDALAYMYRWP